MRRTLSAVVGVAAFGAISPAAFATLYGPGAGGAVPDAMTSFTVPGVFTSTIMISDQGTIKSLNNVTINFGPPTHTWVGDLQIILTAPNSDSVHLISVTGSTSPTTFGDSSDFGGAYVFVNSGGGNFTAAAIAEATGALPVPPGTYNRETNPAAGGTIGVNTNTYAVFTGDPIRGAWTLTFKDWGAGDTGSLASWTLDLTFNPIPAPASLGLLGLAGLMTRNRRRRC